MFSRVHGLEALRSSVQQPFAREECQRLEAGG